MTGGATWSARVSTGAWCPRRPCTAHRPRPARHERPGPGRVAPVGGAAYPRPDRSPSALHVAGAHRADPVRLPGVGGRGPRLRHRLPLGHHCPAYRHRVRRGARGIGTRHRRGVVPRGRPHRHGHLRPAARLRQLHRLGRGRLRCPGRRHRRHPVPDGAVGVPAGRRLAHRRRRRGVHRHPGLPGAADLPGRQLPDRRRLLVPRHRLLRRQHRPAARGRSPVELPEGADLAAAVRTCSTTTSRRAGT